ncbi:hypothetical protein CULCOIPH001_00840 [Corynebacterium ulcerans]|nr:hypothetical protein CULCOIPH001_00840 [Corynebacterium ulcerans]
MQGLTPRSPQGDSRDDQNEGKECRPERGLWLKQIHYGLNQGKKREKPHKA